MPSVLGLSGPKISVSASEKNEPFFLYFAGPFFYIADQSGEAVM